MTEYAKNYAKIANDFARAALRDKKRKSHGLFIQQAARRFIDDKKRARKKSCEFKFVKSEGEDACDFIEKLPHIEGKWESPYIILHPAQIFFIVQLFGFRDKKTGKRRFTSALYATARKSGKSTLAAAILNYCFCCEDEDGAQIISAATTFPQASIIFNIAKRQVEKESELREEFGLEVWAKAISRYETGSNFRPIHAKASTQDGLNPSHTGIDEIHAHKTPDLLNVLQSAAGARANPLWLFTTTEGYTNPGPWEEIRQFAKNLLAGIFGTSADHYLVIFFAVDEENKTLGVKADDEFDQSCWIKANPLIETNPHLLSAIQKEAIEAKQMPSKLSEFRIKRLNRPASVADGFIDLPRWRTCNEAVDIDSLRDEPCYGGMDLASTTDMASLRLVWNKDGKILTHGIRWAPESAVAYRTERGTVPYQSWVEQGLLIQTPGNVIDYEIIEKQIMDVFENFNLQILAYDRWNATDLVNRLVKKELPMIEFIQGPKSYHPAMQALERAYLSEKLLHGGDQLLNWCAANLVARYDQNMNMAPDKRKSADKIDDMTALLMGIGVMIGEETEADPDYDLFFI